ncbi:MAG: pyridoxamine 5'-phosphate oxidase family protein [Oscillospiraceae bacterium]|nr:pyridoxamine 5'-phosphate oxidase family protein [Oscillospiraceae bacterium]
MMKLEEITDINEIDAVLSDAQMCRIALLDGDKPYIAPLLFGYCLSEGSPEFYFRCGEKSELIELIKKNNRAAFETDRLYEVVPGEENPSLFEASYEYVGGTGTIEFITGIDKITGFSHILKKYNKNGGECIISEQILNSFAVLKLTATRIYCKKQRRAVGETNENEQGNA